MQRKQFTFYESFASSILRIRRKADRLAVYDAVVRYAIWGEEPGFDGAAEVAAITFDLIRPVLDAGRRKAEAGKLGGSRPKANRRQTASEKEKEVEKEAEKEVETEKEVENECSLSPSGEGESARPRGESRAQGKYGWVMLTQAEFDALKNDLGAEELARCIAVVDELAQQNGNKYRWRDWNIVLRRCHREGWGTGARIPPDTPLPDPPQDTEATLRQLARIREKMRAGPS